MKLSKIKLAMVASTLLLTSGAYAETINFTGTIVDSSCVATVDSSGSSSVALGKVSKSSLATSGATAAPTPFTISVTGCTASASVAIKFDGTPVTGNNALLALTQETGVATNVGIGIFNNTSTNSSQISLYDASATQTTDTTGAASFPFVAKYVAVGTATAGSANSSATFSITYP